GRTPAVRADRPRPEQGFFAAPTPPQLDHPARLRRPQDGPGSPDRSRPNARPDETHGREVRRQSRRLEVRILQPVVGGVDAGAAGGEWQADAGGCAAARRRWEEVTAGAGAALRGVGLAGRLADRMAAGAVRLSRSLSADADAQGLPAGTGERGQAGHLRDRMRFNPAGTLRRR